VLNVLDLGVVRAVSFNEQGDPEITITPTYSGCPAMDMIAMNIKMELLQNGYKNISIKSVLSPAWTTDWMTEEGKQKLREYGIAPPGKLSDRESLIAFARNADQLIQNCLANSDLLHAKPCTNATIAKSLSIILNVTKFR
jgi:ring-1,2-phenylacetyl-CoA epoxidase subunit PaaD